MLGFILPCLTGWEAEDFCVMHASLIPDFQSQKVTMIIRCLVMVPLRNRGRQWEYLLLRTREVLPYKEMPGSDDEVMATCFRRGAFMPVMYHCPDPHNLLHISKLCTATWRMTGRCWVDLTTQYADSTSDGSFFSRSGTGYWETGLA